MLPQFAILTHKKKEQVDSKEQRDLIHAANALFAISLIVLGVMLGFFYLGGIDDPAYMRMGWTISILCLLSSLAVKWRESKCETGER